MSLLNRLFGQKPITQSSPEDIQDSISTIERYLRKIINHYGEPRFESDTQARQILAVYSFGGVSALAIQRHLSQPEAHAVCMALYKNFFGFTIEDTAAKAQAVITAAPDPTSHLYAIIHRGLDGFLHWQKDVDDGAEKDFGEIMAQIQGNTSKG